MGIKPDSQQPTTKKTKAIFYPPVRPADGGTHYTSLMYFTLLFIAIQPFSLSLFFPIFSSFVLFAFFLPFVVRIIFLYYSLWLSVLVVNFLVFLTSSRTHKIFSSSFINLPSSFTLLHVPIVIPPLLCYIYTMKKNIKKSPRHLSIAKAYNNYEFLNSPHARPIRVLAELLEPQFRFRKYNLRNTVVFFGSARTLSKQKASAALKEIEAQLARKNPDKNLTQRYEQAKHNLIMSRYYEDAAKLAERLTRWFKQLGDDCGSFAICSGGGPGIMEAAGLGAKRANGKSIGFNISLPQEQIPNSYQSKELAFEFHYFFIRKFWFFYLAKALVVFPGGYGTLDEFFEVLTLLQTNKTKKHMPIVLYGREYWEKLINFDEMLKWGTISPEDIKLFKIVSDPDEAFDYLKAELICHYINPKKNIK